MISIPLRWGIIISFAMIVSVSSYINFNWVVDELRPTYLTVVEDDLNDTARLLAALLSVENTEDPVLDPETGFNGVFDRIERASFTAKIYELTKAEVDLFIYITDRDGKVVFHSLEESAVGDDYSRWRDVLLTLRGEYGARTTREDSSDAKTAVLYVAAPIFIESDISGVVTVGKPISWTVLVIDQIRKHVLFGALIASIVSLIFAILISAWIIRPIERFTYYAREVARGNRRVAFPRLGEVSEMRVLGQAYEDMRIALEGKKYVESYVEQLTHELKSPVSAIKGASELLTEDMSRSDRIRFLNNIQIEAGRMTRIINQFFKLSELESRKEIQKEWVDLIPLINLILTDFGPHFESKLIRVIWNHSDQAVVLGDESLISLAIVNLIQNAIDFSPMKSSLTIRCREEGSQVSLIVEDEGQGIPDYALSKIFEKFYSLPRPDNGKKSTGLGLPFVHQIADLHEGMVTLENRMDGGVRASMTLMSEFTQSS